ncbi:MAG TPA: histidine phosphatase family protein [Desulfobacterales bacterium]|nr:histidine phosphatase family protein [Desulfobacterales bacterium]HIP40261.1 histidine phosphatase family protein [Desulfocapsa sulfexigens]
MNKRLVLLRHGNTGYPGRYIGAKDVPLSSDGFSQIGKLKSIFQNLHFDSIYSSPMIRCRQSGEILFDGQPVFFDDDLKEIDFGRWEGLQFDEIVEDDPELVKEWADWNSNFCFPEGERIDHFIKRVHRAGARIKETSGENVLLITHGGVIRTLICFFLNLDPKDYLMFQVQKGKYTTMELFDNGAVLSGLNHGLE